jgi:hypothetical protein
VKKKLPKVESRKMSVFFIFSVAEPNHFHPNIGPGKEKLCGSGPGSGFYLLFIVQNSKKEA